MHDNDPTTMHNDIAHRQSFVGDLLLESIIAVPTQISCCIIAMFIRCYLSMAPADVQFTGFDPHLLQTHITHSVCLYMTTINCIKIMRTSPRHFEIYAMCTLWIQQNKSHERYNGMDNVHWTCSYLIHCTASGVLSTEIGRKAQKKFPLDDHYKFVLIVHRNSTKRAPCTLGWVNFCFVFVKWGKMG